MIVAAVIGEMESLCLSQTFSYNEKVELLTKLCVPQWWDKEIYFLTYELLGDLFEIADDKDINQA